MGKVIKFNEKKQQKQKHDAIDNLLESVFGPITKIDDETYMTKTNEQKTVMFIDEETNLIDELNHKIEKIINDSKHQVNKLEIEKISIYFSLDDFILGCFIGNTMKNYGVCIEIMFYDPKQLEKKSDTDNHKYIYVEDIKNKLKDKFKGDDK